MPWNPDSTEPDSVLPDQDLTPEQQRLCARYGVQTLDELIKALVAHIERLQGIK